MTYFSKARPSSISPIRGGKLQIVLIAVLVAVLGACDSGGGMGNGDSGGGETDSTSTAGFTIRVRFADSFTEQQKATIRKAMDPWEAAIDGDLPSVSLSSEEAQQAAQQCSIEQNNIDDLVLVVSTSSIDGPDGTLAQAGPCLLRTDAQDNFTTALSGIIRIDGADIDQPKLERVVTHEVGHALGIGSRRMQGWGENVSVQDTPAPFHDGTNTTDAFHQLAGSEAYLGEGVPLENAGGRGTAGVHWQEQNFENELMTGALNEDEKNPLSRVTLAALADIGYPVDMEAADDYTLPQTQLTFFGAEADATLSRSAASEDNFGRPEDGQPGESLIAGANNANLWSSAPEDEVFTSLLRFDVPASLPSGLTVRDAGIRLVVNDRNTETTGHNVGVYPVTDAWSEDDVTWETRPATDDSVAAFDFASCDPCIPRIRDLTLDWLTGDAPNHGIALRAPDATSAPTFSVGFDSRHVTQPLQRPLLLISATTATTARTKRIRARSTDQPISFGDDLRTGRIYGVDAEGTVIKTKRLR